MRSLLAALLCAGAAQASGQAARQSMAAAPRVAVTIISDEAKVRVIGADQAQVDVAGAEISMRGSPEAITISGGDASGLRVVVPSDARVNVHSGSGSVVVSSVTGTVRIDTRDGAIEVGDVPRSIMAVSSSGAISINGGGIDGTRIENGSGRVTAHIARGGLNIESSSGTVSVTGLLTNARVFSVSGVITVQGTVAPGGALEVESALATITLYLPATMSAHYELQSTNHSIEAAFGPPAPRRRSPDTPLRHGFQIGNGAAVVRATSIGGSVILEQQ